MLILLKHSIASAVLIAYKIVYLNTGDNKYIFSEHVIKKTPFKFETLMSHS